MANKIGLSIIRWISWSLGALLLSLGLLLAGEIAFRLIFVAPSNGRVSDAQMFDYEDYVLSTGPRGMTVRTGVAPLGNYFAYPGCTGADGVACVYNSLGFRGPLATGLGPKARDEVRIVLTGGSVAAGWNIGDTCLLDRRLEQQLQPLLPGKRIQVYNLSVGAWKSFQELIALARWAQEAQPDVIIALDGVNDLQFAFSMPVWTPYAGFFQREASERHRQWIFEGVGGLLQQFKIAKAATSLVNVAVVQKLKKALAGDKAVSGTTGNMWVRLEGLPMDEDKVRSRTDFDPTNREAAGVYARNVRNMALLARDWDAWLVGVLQPVLYLKNPMAEGEVRLMRSNYAEQATFVAQGYVRARGLLQELSRQERNMRFVDASRLFEGRPEQFFGDYCHLTPEAYGVLADRLVPVIAELVRKGPPSRQGPGTAPGN